MNSVKKFFREQKVLFIVTLILLICTVFGAVSYSWLAGSGIVPCSLVDGSILTQYFHCGDGSEENPFVITRPIHLYNMIYLYQRKEGFANEEYYFQLGYKLPGCDSPMFYNYDDNGEIQSGYTSELNMAYYSTENGGGELLPIGTSVTPFKGVFEGNGLTVSDLHISSSEKIGDKTYDTCDVGIFGYVNGDATIKNVFFKDVSISLKGANPEAICAGNASVHNITGDSAQDIVYVGYLAGHIKTTSMVENVYINNCTITGGTESKSNFGYFGCVEDPETGAPVSALGEKVNNMRTEGNGSGLGGSLDVTSLFHRIENVLGNNPYQDVERTNNYPSEETIIAPSTPGAKPEVTIYATTAIGTNNYYRWSTATAGMFIGKYSTGYNNEAYNYIYGLKPEQTTTVTTLTQSDEWFISQDGRYLSVSDDRINNNQTQESGSSKWLTDDEGHIYTSIDDDTTYYLNRNGTTGITLGTDPETAAVWTLDSENGLIYTTVGGTNYYLIFSGTSWALTATENEVTLKLSTIPAWFISNDGKYLSVYGTEISNDLTIESGAAKWVKDDDGHWYTVINNHPNYLNRDGTSGVVISSQTATSNSTVWTSDTENSIFYTTVGGKNYYLVYTAGAWSLTEFTTSYRITDGEGHYLSENGTAVRSVNSEAQSVRWQVDDSDDVYKFYFVVNGVNKYLGFSNGLAITGTETVWHKDSTGFYTQIAGEKLYLTYNNGWRAELIEDSYKIKSGSNYLTATSQGVTDGMASNSVNWRFTSETGQTQIYTITGTDKYYLKYDDNNTFGLTVTTDNSDDLTVWHRSGNSFYCTVDGTNYYLQNYGGRWVALPLQYYLIKSGNNYLEASGGNTLENTTSEAEATHFFFSDDGTVRYMSGGNVYYLGNTGGRASDTATEWSTDVNNSLTYLHSGIYYLTLNNGNWQILAYPYLYIISDGNGHYLNANGTTLSVGDNEANATKWVFSDTTELDAPAGTIQPYDQEQYEVSNYYLVISGNACTGYTLQLSTTNSNNVWTNAENTLRNNQYNTYYIHIENNTVSTTTTGTVLTFTSSQDLPEISTVAEANTASAPVLSVTAAEPGNLLVSVSDKKDNMSVNFTETEERAYAAKISIVRRGSYIPLRVSVEGESDYDASLPYAVSQSNTGYIVGGAYSDPDTNGGVGDIRVSHYQIAQIANSYAEGAFKTIFTYNGGRYYLSVTGTQISNSQTQESGSSKWQTDNNKHIYTLIEETQFYLNRNGTDGVTLDRNAATVWTLANGTIYTTVDRTNYYLIFNGTSWALTKTQNSVTSLKQSDGSLLISQEHIPINDDNKANYTQFDSVCEKFLKILKNDTTQVYGLHFMDSAISKDHVIQAEAATICGETFVNYDLPESCLDFRLTERGYTTFMAGDFYYYGNDTFFSLHQVFRDEKTKKITSIKELSLIYKHNTDPFADYVYKYTDGSYSNAEITDGNVGTNYTLVFNCDWIKNPTNNNSKFDNNAIYYFEIPCNIGEYALGSVSGKDGAYLMYLDIGANGGAVIESMVSDAGNSDTNGFYVDFRYDPVLINNSDYTALFEGDAKWAILQFSINAPYTDLTNNKDFSVKVKYDYTDTGETYQNGCYTIEVVNKTDSPLTLYVLLCDNDDDPKNAFPYAYKIKYTNNTHAEMTTIPRTISGTPYEFWKIVSGFTIPASGNATPIEYK